MTYPPHGQPQQPYSTGQHPQPYSTGGYPMQPYQQPAYGQPQPYGYGPVQTMQVKERGFNPITFIVHLCLWVFFHWWLALLSIGLWLLVAIPISLIGWRVSRTVPVQQAPGSYPPRGW
ncbi:hypothetical protein AB0J28_01845 [Streptosporangium canum]|uniref:hypothetical protein n=1 Tax=Streptosporangium canum TaxID=324952 RepID=UPI00342871E8